MANIDSPPKGRRWDYRVTENSDRDKFQIALDSAMEAGGEIIGFSATYNSGAGEVVYYALVRVLQ